LQERGDGCEGAAVERCGAEFGEGAEVAWGSVTHVTGEAVGGEAGVEGGDEGIAVDLGDDAGGGDGEREGVAVDKAGLGAGVVEAHGVNQEMVGGG